MGGPVYNEKALLQLVASGDEHAFNQLFNAYHNRLGAFVIKLTGSVQAAEEIVQDIFVKVWLNREALRDIEYFTAYLYTVTRNHTFSYLKKLGREMARKRAWEKVQAAPDSENGRDELYQLIDQAVARLPSQRQKVYLLSREQGLKTVQIADMLAISPETVKKHLVLALRAVKSYVLANFRIISLVILLTRQFF